VLERERTLITSRSFGMFSPSGMTGMASSIRFQAAGEANKPCPSAVMIVFSKIGSSSPYARLQ
jgi:hypothetical protein